MSASPLSKLARLITLAGLLLQLLSAQANSVAAIQRQLKIGDVDGAIAACDRILKARPQAYEIWTLKGIGLQMRGRSGEALKSVRKALSLQPAFIPALQVAGQIEYQTGDPQCQKTLERLLKAKPDVSEAHAMLAALAFERKDCAGTIEHAGKAKESMTNPLARDQYATCLFRLKKFDIAETFFQEQLRTRENDDVRFNLGLAQFESKKYAEAVATLRPLGERNVPDSAALSLLAEAYETNGQTPEALQTLRQAIDVYPGEERHYVNLAAICLERNAFQVGIEVLRIGGKNVPGSSKIQVMQGVLQARAGKMEEAEAAFKRAEALDPKTPLGRVGLAATLLQFNAVDEAIALMREQHTKDPGDPRATSLLAQAILQKGNSPEELQEAQTLLIEVTRLMPNDARAHGLLGKVYFLQQEFTRAVPELETAIRLDPDDKTATYQLMTVYRRLGRTKEIPRLQQRVRELLNEERDRESEGGRYRLAISEDEKKQEELR